MTKNSELRRQSREQLGGKIFATNWLLMVVAGIIIGVVSAITRNPLFLAGIAGLVLAGAIRYGTARITVNLAKGGEKVEFRDLITGFTDGFGKIFLLGFMSDLFVFLWGLLFIIPGIVKSYSYAMAPYIMQDDPSKNWKQCIDESRQMMNGHKAQLFWLEFSFIGWTLLGMLCLGVGVLFVTPYINQARANFYLALKEQQAE